MGLLAIKHYLNLIVTFSIIILGVVGFVIFVKTLTNKNSIDAQRFWRGITIGVAMVAISVVMLKYFV